MNVAAGYITGESPGENSCVVVHSKVWKDQASIDVSYDTGGTEAAVELVRKIVTKEIISEVQMFKALVGYQRKISAQLMPIKYEVFKNIAPEDKQVTCIDIRSEEVETLTLAGWQIFPMVLNSGQNERLYNMLPVTGDWNREKIEEEAWFPDHESLVSGKGFLKLNPFLEKANLIQPSQSIVMYFKDSVLVKMHQKQPQLNGKEHPDIIKFGSGSTFTVSTATNIFTEVGKIGYSSDGKFVLLPFNPFNKPTIISEEDFASKYPGEDMKATVVNDMAAAHYNFLEG